MSQRHCCQKRKTDYYGQGNDNQGNQLAPLRFARNLGLIAAEHSGVLKRQVLRYALGL